MMFRFRLRTLFLIIVVISVVLAVLFNPQVRSGQAFPVHGWWVFYPPD
jgi:hypothetical protein